MMFFQNLLAFFTDPILRAPTIGCMLMCLGASLVGVIVFLRRQSLIGEVLSHAAYPGVILGTVIAGIFFVKEYEEFKLALLALVGAFLTSMLGIWLIHVMERRFKCSADAALCFVLSTFFGVGLTITSEVQFTFTTLYKQVLTYLYGQAATMTDIHIVIYGILAVGIAAVILLLYKEIQIITFDKQYAKSLGISTNPINILVFMLVTIAVIIGIRSVGVVLMSAMLIAPAAAARQFTHRLPVMFLLAAFFGLISGFLGNYLSANATDYFSQYFPSARIILPTGPMIVLVASLICTGALLFAPERGLIVRLIRITLFRYTCIGENVLKAIWRIHPQSKVKLNELANYQACSKNYLRFILWRLRQGGWVEKAGEEYQLTIEGQSRAAKIVRLHRLWEVYLADYLGIGAERVHKNAEEMEHIITPELEEELTLLLNDPKQDPHHQPIPPKEDYHVF
jgi:manganese/zinc/iron transport system permease protein